MTNDDTSRACLFISGYGTIVTGCEMCGPLDEAHIHVTMSCGKCGCPLVELRGVSVKVGSIVSSCPQCLTQYVLEGNEGMTHPLEDLFDG